MRDLREKIHISTMAEDAPALSREHGLGLELADFCTAYNMDMLLAEKDAAAREKMKGIRRLVFHAPFSEMSPAAIDPLIREVTEKRYRQAIALAAGYGIKKLVIHTGFVPRVYFPEWYIPESVRFWRTFLSDLPADMTICLENVMESGPEIQREIAAGVGDERFRLCLDVGHAFIGTPEDDCLTTWIDALWPYLAHVHIHNNDGITDLHKPLGQGRIRMGSVIDAIAERAPEATFTIESVFAADSVDWLRKNKYI